MTLTVNVSSKVASASVEDVQAKAGVSASQLYHYFADKRALVRAVIARQTEAVLQNQQPYLAMRDRGALRPEADPDQLALALLAAVQGGLILTQARRDPTALAVALDTVLAYIHTFAADAQRPAAEIAT